MPANVTPPPTAAPEALKVGFTGTRHGMTGRQSAAFRRLIESLSGRIQFHHGDCVGSDDEAANIVNWAGNAYVVCHPPIDNAHRAGNPRYDELRNPKTHFARNRDIVNETDLLIATPQAANPITAETMGGTAYTVNYARKNGKTVIIILPDGTHPPFSALRPTGALPRQADEGTVRNG